MNDKIKQLLENAEQSDAIAINKWRIENRKQLREQRKKELKELMEKDKTMSNNKQSSVEWLMGKLIEHQIIKVGQTTYGGKVNYKHEILLEQAKAMHKEEVIDSFYIGRYEYNNFDSNSIEYYNETFGGNNEQQ